MPDRRRMGVVVLIALIAVAFAFGVDALDLGSLRIAGVSLAWWYAGVAAPVIATLAVALALAQGDDP